MCSVGACFGLGLRRLVVPTDWKLGKNPEGLQLPIEALGLRATPAAGPGRHRYPSGVALSPRSTSQAAVPKEGATCLGTMRDGAPMGHCPTKKFGPMFWCERGAATCSAMLRKCTALSEMQCVQEGVECMQLFFVN